MREIIFRAWDEENKVMEYGIDIQSGKAVKKGYQFYDKGNTLYDSKPMQFTGLIDKNGTEIYEGDVVKGFDYWNGKAHRFIGQVKYVSTGFEVVGVKQYRGGHTELNMMFQVIGNIYEHPHLLEEI